MNSPLDDDLAALPLLLTEVREYAAAILADLDGRPVAARSPRVTAEPLPNAGVGARAALAAFAERWAPGFSASAGPRYLGFVTGGTTPAALAGDWLTGVFDQNAASAEDSCADQLERQTVYWLREMFGLTSRHEGAFVSGATTSNFAGLAIAREWLGRQVGVEVGRRGLAGLGPVTVLSGTPHSSIYKALSMAGMGRDALRPVPVLPGREAVDVTALEAALRDLDGVPAIVVANAGTVNTVDFDDIRAIAALRERYPFWLHVDGAFGAFAALSGAHAALLDGLDEADSVCVDLHKWLNVPYDSAVQFTRHRDLQLAVFHNAAAYLGPPGDDADYLHLVPDNSRRPALWPRG
jgi:glutamate/tyrosine decarboxylase-like PLP-dependent enzyme